VLRLLCVTLIAAMKTLHEMVADKLERDPSLLRIPLENIDRWLANGYVATHRLEQWRRIIVRAQESPDEFRALLELLRESNDPTTERLKEFAPFAGVLTAMERRVFIRQCVYSH
jgi:hypothetical protein